MGEHSVMPTGNHNSRAARHPHRREAVPISPPMLRRKDTKPLWQLQRLCLRVFVVEDNG